MKMPKEEIEMEAGLAMKEEDGIAEVEGEDGIKSLIDEIGGGRGGGEWVWRKKMGKEREYSLMDLENEEDNEKKWMKRKKRGRKRGCQQGRIEMEEEKGKERWTGLEEEEKWKERKKRRGKKGLPVRWIEMEGATMKGGGRGLTGLKEEEVEEKYVDEEKKRGKQGSWVSLEEENKKKNG